MAAFQFGRSLFKEGDYYRAITEFKRAAFLDPGGPLAVRSGFWEGISYHRGGKYEAALGAFEGAGKPDQGQGALASLLSAETLLAAGRAREASRLLAQAFPPSSLPPQGGEGLWVRARFVLAWCLLAQGKGAEAGEEAGKLSESPVFGRKAAILAEKAGKLQKIPARKPGLGAILSAILPGLGQGVSGRWGDGASALAVNGLFAWGSWESYRQGRRGTGTLLAVVGSGWYAGNIYAGANAAARFNRDHRAGFFEEAWRDCGIPPMEEALPWSEPPEGGP